MPQPSASDLHVDGLLTQISVGYIQDDSNFAADRVFPRVAVNKQSDLYATYDRGDFFRDDFQIRGTASASAGIGYGTGTDNYLCQDWALHIDIDDRTVANADDPFAPMADAARILTQKELIKREVEFMSTYFATGVWGTDVVGGTGFTAWDDASSDVVADISTAQQTVQGNTGIMPGCLMLNTLGWNALRNHPDIVARISGGATPGGPAIAMQQQVAAVLGVDKIVVTHAVRNTAQEGLTDAFSRIGGNHALLCHVDPTPGLMRPTAGMTFVWNGYIGSAEGRRVKRWRIEDIEAERIEMQANWDQKVVASELGYFFSGVAS